MARPSSEKSGRGAAGRPRRRSGSCWLDWATVTHISCSLGATHLFWRCRRYIGRYIGRLALAGGAVKHFRPARRAAALRALQLAQHQAVDPFPLGLLMVVLASAEYNYRDAAGGVFRPAVALGVR